jgi:ABC-type bacteriocin/lantibiotic exporter with double-glycine peptidase domain
MKRAIAKRLLLTLHREFEAIVLPHPVLQSESAECGLACLAMLSSAHGLRVDLAELRQRFSVSLKGANLNQLMRHAQALGFATRPLRLELEEMNQLQLPCMLHWELNHFVVLEKVSIKPGRAAPSDDAKEADPALVPNGSITILDPAVGRRVVPYAEVSKKFTGVALEVTPTTEFKPADLRRKIRLRDSTCKAFESAYENLFESTTLLSSAYSKLHRSRNNDMFTRLEQLLVGFTGSAVVVVGAAHVCGEGGLFELLRAAGYSER